MTAHPHPTPPQAAWARLRAALRAGTPVAVPAPARFAVQVRAYPGAVAVEAQGPLVVETRQHFRHTVLDALAAGARVFVLDLSGVPAVDPAGLGVVVSVVRKVREAGGEVYVAGARDLVRSACDNVALERSFHAYGARDALGEAA